MPPVATGTWWVALVRPGLVDGHENRLLCNLLAAWCVLGLVKRLQAWEDERFLSFAEGRRPALLRYAYRLTGNSEAARDLVQDSLLRCALAWPRITAKEEPEGYVRRIMARAAMNSWRVRGREVGLLLGHQEAANPAGVDDAERLALWHALAQLPSGQRTVLVLRYYEDLSELEIARVLGIRPGTVKSQASRGMTALRAVWGTTLREELR